MKYFSAYIVFFITLCIGLLTACSGSDRVLDLPPMTADFQPISFVGAGAEAQTRASNPSLSEFAQYFRLYGVSYKGSSSFATVFPNYVVWYDPNVGSTTNTSSWEYVGSYSGHDTSWQTNKYWDYDTDYHYFWGIANADDVVVSPDLTASATPSSTLRRVESLQFSLDNAHLTDATVPYYTDPVYVPNSRYGSPVEMPFKRLAAQIRVGFYETIPEVVVSNLRFYATLPTNGATNPSSGASSSTEPSPESDGTIILHGTFATSATITINFDYSSSSAPKSSASSAAGESSTTMTLGKLSYLSDRTEARTEDNFGNLPASITSWLSNNSIHPTYCTDETTGAQYYPIVPYNNTAGLSLLCDYTVTKTDRPNRKSTEVTAVPATVPAAYCDWQPNYLYTYIFKVTDEGNGGIVLHDVQIEPWSAGDGISQEWHNW